MTDKTETTSTQDSTAVLTIIDGKVLPKHVYHPNNVVTTWFKTWGIQCGKCSKDFHRFALFGRPVCPYCGTKNAPQFYVFC